MTLGEKILSLRTARDMSQDDLAEKLEVSRQSVSKWETGQSTPDLDKIIRLSDLFGVSVDELVRSGEAPRTQVVYVEQKGKWELSPVQKLGMIMAVTGAVYMMIGLIEERYVLVYYEIAPLFLLSLPLLLAKKRPWLTLCWVLMALSFVFVRPQQTAWGLPDGLYKLFRYFKLQDPSYSSYFASHDNSSLLFGGIVGIVRGSLTLALIVYTGYTCGKTWRETWKKRRKDG